jgi:Uma2 family endonuclease
MAITASLPRWTIEQYLALEQASDVRHEYVDGIVYALAGGTQRHSALCAAIGGRLFLALRGSPCRMYTSDLKVRIGASRYFYPDVSIDGGVDVPSTTIDALTTPRLVVEVVSESTAAYDRGAKRLAYQALPTLRYVMLVESEHRLVELYRRGTGSRWTVRRYGAGETVALPDLGVQLVVDEIYAGVMAD